MDNTTIALSTEQSLAVTTQEITVRRINLRPDDSGVWDIGVQFTPIVAERAADATVKLTERHLVQAQIQVTRAEIAAAAGIAEEDVRTTLTLAQTETHVTTIALGKVLAVMGLSA